MNAVVMNFSGGKTTRKGNHIILEVEGVKNRSEAAAYVGKKVCWVTPSGKKICGQITSPHGNKGALKAIMEKGLPGEVLGREVSIEG